EHYSRQPATCEVDGYCFWGRGVNSPLSVPIAFFGRVAPSYKVASMPWQGWCLAEVATCEDRYTPAGPTPNVRVDLDYSSRTGVAGAHTGCSAPCSAFRGCRAMAPA